MIILKITNGGAAAERPKKPTYGANAGWAAGDYTDHRYNISPARVKSAIEYAKNSNLIPGTKVTTGNGNEYYIAGICDEPAFLSRNPYRCHDSSVRNVADLNNDPARITVLVLKNTQNVLMGSLYAACELEIINEESV